MWKARSLKTDYEWAGELEAYWEVDCDPISEDYVPSDITADELFQLWSQKVEREYSNGLVPITWYVQCLDQKKLEKMPLQFAHDRPGNIGDFLTSYTWPTDIETGKRLNWLTIPVVDKHWNDRQSDEGGFIQEATGWKPSILQPFVYLPSLTGKQ